MSTELEHRAGPTLPNTPCVPLSRRRLAVIASCIRSVENRFPDIHAGSWRASLRRPGTPSWFSRPVPGNPGQIIATGDAITVRLERRAYLPVLRKASLPPATTVPLVGEPDPALPARLNRAPNQLDGNRR